MQAPIPSPYQNTDINIFQSQSNFDVSTKKLRKAINLEEIRKSLPSFSPICNNTPKVDSTHKSNSRCLFLEQPRRTFVFQREKSQDKTDSEVDGRYHDRMMKKLNLMKLKLKLEKRKKRVFADYCSSIRHENTSDMMTITSQRLDTSVTARSPTKKQTMTKICLKKEVRKARVKIPSTFALNQKVSISVECRKKPQVEETNIGQWGSQDHHRLSVVSDNKSDMSLYSSVDIKAHKLDSARFSHCQSSQRERKFKSKRKNDYC